MPYRIQTVLFIALCILAGWARSSLGAGVEAEQQPRPVLEVSADIALDPQQTYGAIIVTKSGVTIDGRGAWLVGPGGASPKDFHGTAISADGVSQVVLKNVNARGWETGLHVRRGDKWLIENCNFSDNFHDPDFGWGENGRRGGIVLDRVRNSVLKNNRANRVWDACVLVDCDDNAVEGNDFSHTSNTCLKLWTSRRNTIHSNRLSHGIRISPGEVHARDSTCVLIESGSNDNRFLHNDCTYGGDGIFVRVLNGWCSTGNHFEANDCSYANNNGVECWAPRNVFVKNKANHCSYGFWLGGSDQTRLIENEACFNGLADGHHNSPHLPDSGHAGIVFMFGSSSHTLARGNVCRGNNGAGIALIGDLESKGQKWRAYHWIIEGNELVENRWGLLAKHADWIVARGNTVRGNSAEDIFLGEDVTRYTGNSTPLPAAAEPPLANLTGPTSVKVGQPAVWDASASKTSAGKASSGSDPVARELEFTWDVDGEGLGRGAKLEHTFDRVGFHRIGLNVSNGLLTEPAWRDVYVLSDVEELGTEGTAERWSIEDFHDRQPFDRSQSRANFSEDRSERLLGESALQVVIDPYAGFRASLTYPASRDAAWLLKNRSTLSFWLKAINADVTGWQGGPFVVLHGEGDQRYYIEPQEGYDPMRQLEHSEAREGWRRFEIPLRGDQRWRTDGELPETARGLSIGFDSWGAPALRLWIDGLALE